MDQIITIGCGASVLTTYIFDDISSFVSLMRKLETENKYKCCSVVSFDGIIVVHILH